MIGHNTALFLTKPACAFHLGLTLWSGIINSENLFPIKVRGCELAITTIWLFCSGEFGAIILFYVWGFTIYEVGDKFTIGVSEGGRFCAGGRW